MPIKIQCACGQALNVPDTMAGKTGKCPKCQKPIKIPGGGAAPVAAAPATAQPAPVRKAAAEPRPVAAAPVATAPKLDDLFDEVGLKQRTGPICPGCGADRKAGALLCTSCGLNFETGDKAVGFSSTYSGPEFKNHYLQEAVENMQRDVVSEERHDKAGTPWWMIMSYLLGAITLCGAGVIIVDGRVNPADPSTPMGKIQQLPILVVLGVTLFLTGQSIHVFAHLSIVVFAFRQGVGAGLGCLFVPLFSYIYGIMHWADNKSAIIAIGTSIVIVSTGMGLIIAGGLNALQAALN